MNRTLHITSRSNNRAVDVLFLIAISPNKVGGIELFARHLSAAMERRHKRIAYCFSSPPNETVRLLLERPNTQLHHLDKQGEFSASSVRQLWKLIRTLRPKTVVYSFGGILRPLPWICKLAGVKQIVYNDHASRVPGDESSGYARSLTARLITAPVTSVIAVSEFVAGSSRRENLHSAPVVAVPNGIDLSRRGRSVSGQEFRARYGIPQPCKVVSQLSWLVKEKGVDIFLKAAAEVLRSRDDVHFVVGGDGEGRSAYEQLARELGLDGHVTFTGQIPDPIASGFYLASDVFCLPSRWNEACGLVLLEAMSFAVPVVASRVGGIPEFVRDGFDGLLTGGGESAFAGAVLTLLSDEGLRRKMGESARRNVEEAFDVRLMAERYAELLDAPGEAPVVLDAVARSSQMMTTTWKGVEREVRCPR